MTIVCFLDCSTVFIARLHLTYWSDGEVPEIKSLVRVHIFRNCSPHIIRQTINVSSIGRRLDTKLHEQMKICVNSMLCLMARPQIHPPNVKTCLDVVDTYTFYAESVQVVAWATLDIGAGEVTSEGTPRKAGAPSAKCARSTKGKATACNAPESGTTSRPPSAAPSGAR